MSSNSPIYSGFKIWVSFVIFSVILSVCMIWLTSIDYTLRSIRYENSQQVWRKPNNEQFHFSSPPTSSIEPAIERQLYKGELKYSFISSIMESGVASNVAHELINLTNGKLDYFNLQAESARFLIQTRSNSYDSKNQIEAFLYRDEVRNFFIYKADDGELFNEYGNSITTPTWLAKPTLHNHRISSHFSHSRLHPITKRYTPHNGTDYATPTGSKVVSVANGEVIASRYNRFAGNYITIKHSDTQVSRYLHLSESLVSKGDRVTAGDLIGLSGNSGRTTGPHLHFELIIEGMPVNFTEYTANQWIGDASNHGQSQQAKQAKQAKQTYQELTSALF
ncbi:peptidoglycan DD-metalloendopeptidase family protein [Vibrio lamellibrachiae]|uniref:peptidoglycan DD-metalloendopeptidase family protein n=1 Tax=Vibrio lamellibrachiae TaxID=2910253 RepID=UPI003D0FF77B